MGKIKNEHVRGTARLRQLEDKVREGRLRWLGYIKRRDGQYMDAEDGADQRGYEVGWCDREGCRRLGKMETDEPLWRPLEEKVRRRGMCGLCRISFATEGASVVPQYFHTRHQFSMKAHQLHLE